MPLQWRLHVLGARLSELLGGRRIDFQEVDLFRLQGRQREVAVDALVSGAPLPLLVHGDRIVCAGAFEVDEIATAVTESASR
ncbi:MAG: hypothetical protein U1E08_05675 [Coriobacteriia bacterium]|nr:hypothetical protein [Actinomycetota bacterium]MDZ4167163.1 hypothetical protein [Coriobacteriia bacterium]